MLRQEDRISEYAVVASKNLQGLKSSRKIIGDVVAWLCQFSYNDYVYNFFPDLDRVILTINNDYSNNLIFLWQLWIHLLMN